MNITAYRNQTLSSEKLQALLLLLKEQKRRMIVGFIANKYKKETVVYKGQVSKEEVLPRHRYKETRILLNNTAAFS